MGYGLWTASFNINILNRRQERRIVEFVSKRILRQASGVIWTSGVRFCSFCFCPSG